MTGKTLYDKIWDAHLAHEAEDGTSLLYIDRHLVHEVTSPQAFEGLRMAAEDDAVSTLLVNFDRLLGATPAAMHEIARVLIRLLAPILPHTCEEAWEHIPLRPVQEPTSVIWRFIRSG